MSPGAIARVRSPEGLARLVVATALWLGTLRLRHKPLTTQPLGHGDTTILVDLDAGESRHLPAGVGSASSGGGVRYGTAPTGAILRWRTAGLR